MCRFGSLLRRHFFNNINDVSLVSLVSLCQPKRFCGGIVW
jgi:hypothetical protein